MRKLVAAIAAVVVICAVATVSPSHASAAPSALSAQGHPRIQAAVAALKDARAELAAAPNDFGGHKADAVKAIDNAIKQLNLALQFANK